MSDSKPLEWAVKIIGDAPPMQNVVAFLIIVLLAAPLIRAGWREFRTREGADRPPAAAPHELIQQTPWLIETLTRIQLEGEQLARELQKLSSQVAVIDKMLRRRSGRSKKLKSSQLPDD